MRPRSNCLRGPSIRATSIARGRLTAEGRPSIGAVRRSPILVKHVTPLFPYLAIMTRGSRKHILDWTSQPRFLPELLALAELASCRVTSASIWQPMGEVSPTEVCVRSRRVTLHLDSPAKQPRLKPLGSDTHG